MALKDELSSEVAKIFGDRWEERDGTVVPESEDLTLGNDAVKLNAVVLYADMADSTALVDKNKPHFAAEVYKAYLHCAAKVVRNWGGEITAYDGDRLMAVFIGNSKNTSAVTAALKLNYTRLQIINPAIKVQYPNTSYELKHVVGIDTSELFIARTGARGANDLVWVGRAANHAAKLSALSHEYAINITKEVYDCMDKSVKFDAAGSNMWEAATWNTMNRNIYRSNYTWSI